MKKPRREGQADRDVKENRSVSWKPSDLSEAYTKGPGDVSRYQFGKHSVPEWFPCGGFVVQPLEVCKMLRVAVQILSLLMRLLPPIALRRASSGLEGAWQS